MNNKAVTLDNIWKIILIIIGILFVSQYFFGYDLANEIKKAPSKIESSLLDKNTINENEVVIDGETLKLEVESVDGIRDIYSRFRKISIGEMGYEEDETSDLLTFHFKDDSGYLNNKCVTINRFSLSENRNICNDCSNKSEGKLYCSISDYLHDQEGGTLIASFTASGDGVTHLIDRQQIQTKTIYNLVKINADIRCEEGIKGYCIMSEQIIPILES